MKNVLRFLTGLAIIAVVLVLLLSASYLLGWLMSIEFFAWLWIGACAIIASVLLTVGAYQLGKSLF